MLWRPCQDEALAGRLVSTLDCERQSVTSPIRAFFQCWTIDWSIRHKAASSLISELGRLSRTAYEPLFALQMASQYLVFCQTYLQVTNIHRHHLKGTRICPALRVHLRLFAIAFKSLRRNCRLCRKCADHLSGLTIGASHN